MVRSLSLGMGEYHHLQNTSLTRMFSQVNLHFGKHSRSLFKRFAVQPNRVPVFDALADKYQPFSLTPLIFQFGLVYPKMCIRDSLLYQ